MLSYYESRSAHYIVPRETFYTQTGQRAWIDQIVADGMQMQAIACSLGVRRPTVQLWRQRFLTSRLAILKKDVPCPGRNAQLLRKKIRQRSKLLCMPPHATHWNTRSMAKYQSSAKPQSGQYANSTTSNPYEYLRS